VSSISHARTGRGTYLRQLLARAVVVLTLSYALPLGGTFNAILHPQFRQVTLALLTGGVLVWLALVWWRDSGFVTPLDPALALWALAYAAASLNSDWTGRAAIGAWYAGLYGGVWVVLSDLRQRGLPGRWLTDAALIASVPLIVFALLQVLPWIPQWMAVDGVDVAFAPPRPSSTLGNPNPLGTVMAMLIPFGLVRVRWSLRPGDRVLSAVWLLLALGTLFLTYSRGAWLASAMSLLVWGGLMLVRWFRQAPDARPGFKGLLSRRTQAVAVVVGVVVVVALVASASTFNTPRRDTGSRLGFYEIAWQSFTEHPLTGTGPFTFGLSLAYERSIPPDQPHSHAHNLPLNVLSELGVLGLLALSVTVFLLSWYGWCALRAAPDTAEWAYRAACGASLAACGVHSLVDMSLMFPAVMLLALLVMAAGIGTARPAYAARIDGRVWRAAWRLLFSGLWIVILVAGWWTTRIYNEFVRGEQLLVDRDYARSGEVLGEVADRLPWLALYHAEYGYARGLAAYYGDDESLAIAIRAYERALDLEAPHAVWWANLAMLYAQAAQPDSAVAAMRQAVLYAPDDPDLWLNLGILYETQGMSDEARTAYRQALIVDNRWGHSSFWMETALRQDVRAAAAVEPTSYMQALALWSAGERGTALDGLEQRITRDPVEPRWYFEIARLYIAGGQLDRAHDYLDAARVLARYDVNRAWIEYLEAQIALAEGDPQAARERLDTARERVMPDTAGQVLPYGRDVTNLQFLHLAAAGTVLPQVRLLGPDPVLTDLLRAR
jgi:tetratricopeptide (TPR) repeat protein